MSCQPGRHAGSLDDGGGFWCFEIVDQCLGGVGLLGVGGDRRGEHQLLLQFAREGADEFDAGRDQDIGQEHAKLGLALGDGRRDLGRGGLHLGLGLHFLCDAEAFEHLCHVSARGACRQEGDGRRREQGLLEGVRRRDVGLWRAGANDDAIADAGDIDGGAGGEAGLCRGVLEDIDGHDDHVERRAGIHPRDDVGRGIEMDRQFMPGRLLERRGKGIHGGGHRAAGDDLEFGGLKRGSRSHDERSRQQDCDGFQR